MVNLPIFFIQIKIIQVLDFENWHTLNLDVFITCTCIYIMYIGFTETCGGVFHYKSGLIKSPDINRDGWHDPFVDCLWTLQADQDHVIRFEIILYATSPTTGCFSDVLVVSNDAIGNVTSSGSSGAKCCLCLFVHYRC